MAVEQRTFKDAGIIPILVRRYIEGTEEGRDAEPIAEALRCPTMRFVAAKTADQLNRWCGKPLSSGGHRPMTCRR
jgi:hypothetical protein